MRRAIYAFCLLLALPALAQQTILRHDNYLVFMGNENETVKLEVAAMARPPYQEDAQVSILDSTSHTVLEQAVPVGKTVTLEYKVQTPGLHAVGITTGQSLATARLLDKPFGLVAWEKTTLWICGAIAPQYFLVPQACKQFDLYVAATVTTEGAAIKVLRPNGQVALEQEGDFDERTRLQVEVPEGMDNQPWSLVITDAADEKLILDDVEIYLGRMLPPYLCEQADWPAQLATAIGEEKISQRVPLKNVNLRDGGTATLEFTLDAILQTKMVALRGMGQDVDYPEEGTFTVNGQGEYAIPVTGDGVTTQVTTMLKAEHLQVGLNVLELKHDNRGSGNLGFSQVELLFGDDIHLEE